MARLVALMPPPTEAARTDWAEMERTWGTRFPADFRWFIDTYGPGSVGDYLVIGRCFGPPSSEDCVDVEAGDRPFPEPYGLLAWGGNPDGDACFFKTAGDPEDWHVVIWRRHHAFREPTSREYPCGLVEFLLRTFDADLPHQPFSGTDLWGQQHRLTFQPEEHFPT
ncbi:MAG: SMI1/KNR4 family protein [Streptomyces sp.]|uniref:SMI1/KNR4 family protein n=1 Tax=Streptomyces sp. TaxID=1931 RepID=UPI0025F69041|nr:SMI1/KNR4 family protein [Streptomyces sp.]MBW8792381.1 SMI1/KNR4 family protein [Streptomyces sp.]